MVTFMKCFIAYFLFLCLAGSSVGYAQTNHGDVVDVSIRGAYDGIPVFVGGIDAMTAFFKKNLAYSPAVAGKEGTVKVRFVVGAEGDIFEPEIVQTLDVTLEEEALRVVRLMPRWIPARSSEKTYSAYYTLAIAFSPRKEKELPINTKAVKQTDKKMLNNQLLVINGQVLGTVKKNKARFEGLEPKSIESMTVLSAEQATEKFGKKGKEGAIIIALKK